MPAIPTHATVWNKTKAGRFQPVSAGESCLAFEVAGLRVNMVSAPDGPRLAVPPSIESFLSCSETAGMDFAIEWAEQIPVPPGKPLFDSGGVWTLYGCGSAYEFVFRSPATGDAPYKAAILDADFCCGSVLLSRTVFGGRQTVYPLEYPLDELLVIHRLARGEGVEVHACGVQDNQGRGLLFVGHSGAGKSTLARLWTQQGGARILSDDRVILRRDAAGRIIMHGTPWHGEARLALPVSAPLHAVYFLQHGAQNEFASLEAGRAAAELIARSFLPFHNAAGLEFSLEFFAHMVTEVPCCLFRFLPDVTAVRAIESDARVL
jgi:hypothetical protein